MSCVNTRYTPDELESIFLWDSLCDELPLTAEERRETKDRDYYATHGAWPVRDTDEEKRSRKREYNRLYREAHRAEIRLKDAAYREKNRASINERQREYDRAKQYA